MSTVPLRAQYLLHVSVLRVAARVVAVIVPVPDVFTEAQDRSRPSKGADDRQV